MKGIIVKFFSHKIEHTYTPAFFRTIILYNIISIKYIKANIYIFLNLPQNKLNIHTTPKKWSNRTLNRAALLLVLQG